MPKYNFTLNLEEVQETLKEAIIGGYSAYIIINGEFYEVDAGALPEVKKGGGK